MPTFDAQTISQELRTAVSSLQRIIDEWPENKREGLPRAIGQSVPDSVAAEECEVQLTYSLRILFESVESAQVAATRASNIVSAATTIIRNHRYRAGFIV